MTSLQDVFIRGSVRHLDVDFRVHYGPEDAPTVGNYGPLIMEQQRGYDRMLAEALFSEIVLRGSEGHVSIGEWKRSDGPRYPDGAWSEVWRRRVTLVYAETEEEESDAVA